MQAAVAQAAVGGASKGHTAARPRGAPARPLRPARMPTSARAFMSATLSNSDTLADALAALRPPPLAAADAVLLEGVGCVALLCMAWSVLCACSCVHPAASVQCGRPSAGPATQQRSDRSAGSRRRPSDSCPLPPPPSPPPAGFGWDSCKGQNWWRTLRAQIPNLAAAGVTHVWLPPPSQSVSSEGYLPGQLYSLDSKYGTEAELRALCADLLAAGMR